MKAHGPGARWQIERSYQRLGGALDRTQRRRLGKDKEMSTEKLECSWNLLALALVRPHECVTKKVCSAQI
jgi:hypothetical protein